MKNFKAIIAMTCVLITILCCTIQLVLAQHDGLTWVQDRSNLATAVPTIDE